MASGGGAPAPIVEPGNLESTCFAGNAGPAFLPAKWLSNDPNLGPDDPASLLELYLPPNVAKLRGLVFMHGRGTPERPSHTRGMPEVAQVWSFGMIRGYIWDIDGDRLSPDEQVKLLTDTIAAWAALTGHPELMHVPVLAIGESRTASLPAELESYWPGRIVGHSQVVGGVKAADVDAALLKVPSMVLPSELDAMDMKLEQHFFAARARGGLWAGSVQWKHPHGFYEAWDVDWPLFNELVRLRVPKERTAENGPVPLKALEETDGWLGDASVWTGWNTIAPFAEFVGDRARAAWLPSRAAAYAWRAFSVPDPKLQVTAPTTSYSSWSKSPKSFGVLPSLGFNRKSSIDFEAVALFEPAPAEVEFFVGDVAVGKASGPGPYRVSGQGFAPGVHAVIAVGTFADGHQESSRPATIAILPDEACP